MYIILESVSESELESVAHDNGIQIGIKIVGMGKTPELESLATGIGREFGIVDFGKPGIRIGMRIAG